jgi:hypothetical protein
MIFAIYEDDGPNGYSVQDCRITSPWKILYIMKTYQDFKELEQATLDSLLRKNARITEVFSNDDSITDNEARMFKNGRYTLFEDCWLNE